jgi:hypothetical protein
MTYVVFCVGHVVVDICLIFRILPSSNPFIHETLLGRRVTSRFLAYVRRYDVVPQQGPSNPAQHGIYPEPNTGLFLLKRARRSSGDVSADIVPLDQLRSPVDVAPRFGEKANPQLTNTSSMAFATEFWLNKYFTKELYYSLSQ